MCQDRGQREAAKDNVMEAPPMGQVRTHESLVSFRFPRLLDPRDLHDQRSFRASDWIGLLTPRTLTSAREAGIYTIGGKNLRKRVSLRLAACS
jgi:hypothetical protein